VPEEGNHESAAEHGGRISVESELWVPKTDPPLFSGVMPLSSRSDGAAHNPKVVGSNPTPANGRPTLLRRSLKSHFFATSSRCQRRIVSGVTIVESPRRSLRPNTLPFTPYSYSAHEGPGHKGCLRSAVRICPRYVLSGCVRRLWCRGGVPLGHVVSSRDFVAHQFTDHAGEPEVVVGGNVLVG